MKRWIILILLFFCTLLAAQENRLNDLFISSAQTVKPSVIFIATYTPEGGALKRSGYGTGTIISESGYIVTNYHVISDSRVFSARLFNGRECSFYQFPDGSYSLSDPETDLAVMRLKCPENTELTPVRIGNSENAAEGQWVIAVGNPYGLSNSITSGIISSVNRSDVGFTDIEDFIQTDVPINPGNSGGPLINLQGEMIGINTAIRTVSGGYQGISFSIPSHIVMKVYKDLIEYGRVRRGWIGILVKEHEGISRKVTVLSVLKDSPAERIGLKKGDIIEYIDNSPVTSKSMLLKSVKNKKIGSRLTITINRRGVGKHFSITMREKVQYKQVNTILSSLYSQYGIMLDLNVENDRVIISDVSPWKMDIHRNSLQQGDTVVEINSHQIESVEDFASVFRRNRYKLESLKIIRDNREYFIDIGSQRSRNDPYER